MKATRLKLAVSRVNVSAPIKENGASYILGPHGQKIFGELDFVDPKDRRLTRF
jgi:hypothetical protein